MTALGKDLENLVIPDHALDESEATAGGSGDNVQVVGDTIDLNALATHAQTVAFIIAAEAVLAATESLTLTADVQQSADGAAWTELVASKTILTLTSAAGGTEKGAGKIGADLTKGARYVRVRVTPNLSAGGTDTSKIMGAAVFGGLQELPQ